MIRDAVHSAFKIALPALLIGVPVELFAQAASSIPAVVPHSQAPTAVAARRNGDVQIDGKLDEAAWAAAAPITSFVQFDPNEGQPVSERTEAHVLIDDVAIYVAMRMYDSNPAAIQSQLARRDEPIEGDLVEVSFDSYHDHLTGVIFRLSPAGARRDAIMSSRGNQDNSWDAVWEGSATVDSQGWSAEFRIPLSQLRFNPNLADQIWGMQLSRKIARKAEIAGWSFTPKTQQGGVPRFGHLTGLGHLASAKRLELVPYALTKNVNPDAAANDPLRKRNQIVPGVGLDVKYGITSNLTLDATFNPDFGQVEVDPAVVNLSAFETFYPEKRPFFVEGANIFGFGDMRTNNSSAGYNFLHSRRIGRAPQRFIGGPDVAWVDAPIETTIAGAAKLTGRAPGGYSFGILDAVTMREEAVYRDKAGADHRATVEPRANYFAGRAKRDMREGNTTIGIAATAVNRQLDDAALTPIFRTAAYAAGVDWQHAWGNRTWALDGNFVMTNNRGSAQAVDILQRSSARYLQRPDRESFRRDSTKTSLTGHVAELTFAKTAGTHWRGSITAQDYSPTFEINELGFLGQTDIRGIAPLVSYSETRPGKYFRRWDNFLFWNPTWTYDGDMTFNGVGSIFEGELPNFWSVFMRGDWRPAVFDPGLTRGGPVGRVVSGGGYQGELESDRRKRYTYGAHLSRSFNSAGGTGLSISPFTRLRPSTALRISLSPQFSRTHAIGQFVTRVRDPLATNTYGARYVFATLDQTQVSMVTRVDWTFTPKLSLQIFAQPLLAAGDFRDYKEFAKPREFDFSVYGRDKGTIARAGSTYTVDPDGTGPAQAFSFGDRDFNSRSLRGNAVLRWEYRPGSALFLVWQQSREGFEPTGQFELGRDFGELLSAPPQNVFVVKGTWWIGR